MLPCFTSAEVAAARERIAMQQALGTPVRWVAIPAEVDSLNPTLAPGRTLGASYCAQDGYIAPPRNVSAYTAALLGSGVLVAEQTAFTGLRGPVVLTPRGEISAGLVILTGGPKLAAVGALAGVSIAAGGARHRSR